MNQKLSILIFTKTYWEEPPRIRHQLTNLLVEQGHKIIFFEKSSYKQRKILKYKKDNINFIRHFELIPNMLRPWGFLDKINNFIAKKIIKKVLNKDAIDLVINFNYDYTFLKDLFPNKKIITIINDDFIDMAKPWMKKIAKMQLRKTCENSYVTLALSYPLLEQVKQFSNNVELFLPWAENPYKLHKKNIKKDTVLWWGYIRHDIDWGAIEFLLKEGISIVMVGPVAKQNNTENIVNKLKKYKNFHLKPSMDLNELEFDHICCSLLSYRKDVEYDRATTISNRGFNLLSNGIPLVYANLPNLIKAPKEVITKCNTNKEYLNAINYFKENWEESQYYIEDFLKQHYAENRLNQLMNFIK